MKRLSVYFVFLSLIVPVNAGIGDLGKLCLAAGTALLGAGTAINFSNWLFNQSDETLYRTIHADYTYLYDNYMSTWQQLEHNYHLSLLTTNEAKRKAKSINEPLLYQFALYFKEHEIGIDQIVNDLSSRISALKKNHAKMGSRLNQLHEKASADAQAWQLYNDVQAILQTVWQGIPYFELVHYFFKEHVSYFDLFEAEDCIMRVYEVELHALDSYPNDAYFHQYTIKQQIKQIGSFYSYVEYQRLLDDTITHLDMVIYNAAAYKDRAGWALMLKNKLSYLKSVVNNLPEYNNEYYLFN